MSEKEQSHSLPHSLNYIDGMLSVNGVSKVIAVSEKEAQFKLFGSNMSVKGDGINVTKLDRESGVVVLECKSLHSVTYRQSSGVRGLFR